MSHRFAELYLAWLLENCEARNYHEISGALGECCTIAKRNESERAWLTEELIAFCMDLLKDFSRVPPGSKNPYIRDNVYQTLESLGKNRAWVDRHR